MKKSEIKKLDKFWAAMVREIGNYTCQCCGRSKSQGWVVAAAHIVGRTCRTTRWGVEVDGIYDSNGMALCKACHDQYDQHLEKEEFIRRVVIGEERYQWLRSQEKVIAKYQDYEETRGRLEAQIENNRKRQDELDQAGHTAGHCGV